MNSFSAISCAFWKPVLGRPFSESLVGTRRRFTAWRVINVRDRLNEVFGNNRVVGLGHDVEWPPRSPDLTPCDFFLWGYIKSKVFVNPPQTIHNLRQKIINEFNALQQQQDMIRNAVRGMQKRALEDMSKDMALNFVTE